MSKITSKTIQDIKNDPSVYAHNITIKKLENIIKHLSEAYYNTDKALVSDAIFDTLIDVLRERDPNNEVLLTIGAPVNKKLDKLKVKLPYFMGSLNKIRPDKENLDDWTNKYTGPYIISDKLDGVSAQLYKETDNIYKLYSRGDGQEGHNISNLIQYLFDLTLLEELPVKTSIRGEIIISKHNFDKIKDTMKNARNAVSGVVNSKKPNMKIVKLCEFVAYSILNPIYTPEKQYKLLEKYKFLYANYKIVKHITQDILTKYLIERKKESEYEIDGIVVFDNKEYELREENPEYAFAFKITQQDQIFEATIIKVLWEASIDGYLKPRIQIEPLDIGGVTISYATAFNAKYVLDNSLGPNAIIKITRSGDVIPYIIETVKGAETAQMPEEKYRWNDTKIDIILTDLDNNQDVNIKIIYHFFNTLGVEYMGDKLVGKLYETGYKTIEDTLKVFIHSRKALYDIHGLGEKIIDKIYENILNAFSEDKLDLVSFMCASHMFGRGLGRKKIQEIIKEYPNLLLEKWTKNTLIEKVINIKGFSDKTANQFADNMHDFKIFFKEINKIINIEFLKEENISSETDTNSESETSSGQDMTGLVFVFTGFRDKDLEKKIEKLGGKITNSVSKNTTAVVCSSLTDEKTSKITEAEKRNIKIYTKSQFLNKYKL
jgi:DNA ligase (NAD+)